MAKITKKEIAIMKKAQAGDKSAFDALFYRYKTFVENILVGYVKDMDEAKDLANIVFLKVHKKLSKFTDDSSFGGWIRTLAKNTAVDYLRNIKIFPMSIDSEDCAIQLENYGESNEQKIINRMTFDRIMKIIEKLPNKTQKINKLFYLEGMTVLQISKEISVPSGTVKSVLARTRRYIKKQLKIN